MPTDAGVNVPEVGRTEEDILSYLAAISRAVISGQMDPRVSEPLIAVGRISLNAVKQKDQKNEILELKRMLEEANNLNKEGLAREVSERQHSNTHKSSSKNGQAGSVAKS